jgi:hypothetical protein
VSCGSPTGADLLRHHRPIPRQRHERRIDVSETNWWRLTGISIVALTTLTLCTPTSYADSPSCVDATALTSECLGELERCLTITDDVRDQRDAYRAQRDDWRARADRCDGAADQLRVQLRVLELERDELSATVDLLRQRRSQWVRIGAAVVTGFAASSAVWCGIGDCPTPIAWGLGGISAGSALFVLLW